MLKISSLKVTVIVDATKWARMMASLGENERDRSENRCLGAKETAKLRVEGFLGSLEGCSSC